MSVFAPISAPILQSVDQAKVSKFLRDRGRYELEIEAKTAEDPYLIELSYKFRIDHGILHSLILKGKFESVHENETFDILTDEGIETFIRWLVDGEDVLYDPTLILRKLLLTYTSR